MGEKLTFAVLPKDASSVPSTQPPVLQRILCSLVSVGMCTHKAYTHTDMHTLINKNVFKRTIFLSLHSHFWRLLIQPLSSQDPKNPFIKTIA